MTPLWGVPYPPYFADGERPRASVRIDWAMLGIWLCRLLFGGTMLFTLGFTAWLFL